MKIVFATNNPNKLAEIKQLMPEGIDILNLKDINCLEELPETSDTGLEIDALDGRPGVYSARYAGPECKAEDNIQKILGEMKGKMNRGAIFRTIISLVIDGNEFQFEGGVEGQIIAEKWGEMGFGYDPIFLPDGHEKSYAQMSIEEKGAISHRGLAVKKLIQFLEKRVK